MERRRPVVPGLHCGGGGVAVLGERLAETFPPVIEGINDLMPFTVRYYGIKAYLRSNVKKIGQI